MLQWRAGFHMPAGRAEHAGRVAAPVDEKDHLLAPVEPVVHLVHQQPRQRDGSARPQHLDAHVDDVDRRQLAVVHAPGERRQVVLARPDIRDRLQRGRGGAQQAHGLAELGAIDRHVATVVPRRLVLFVGGFVLLIHDDQPQVANRGEHRRPRPHHHARLAGRQRLPAVEPLAFAEVAVPDNDLVVRRDGLQPPVQARHGLRRERNLRDKVDHAATRREDCRHRMEVDLRFPRARHAMQQVHGEGRAIEIRPHRRHNGRLLLVELRRNRRDYLAMSPVVAVSLARDPLRFLAHQPALDQGVGYRRCQAQARKHQGFSDRLQLLPEKIIKPRLLGGTLRQGGQFVGRDRPRHRKQPLQLERRAAAHRRRQHCFDHAVESGRIIRAHPSRELQQIGRHRGERMHHLGDPFEFFEWKPDGLSDLSDNAQPVPLEDRHADERTHHHRGAQGFGHAVMQQLVKPRERMNPDDHALFVPESRGGWQCGSCTRSSKWHGHLAHVGWVQTSPRARGPCHAVWASRPCRAQTHGQDARAT